MTDHGTLFGPPMVDALLRGMKTETRRLAKDKLRWIGSAGRRHRFTDEMWQLATMAMSDPRRIDVGALLRGAASAFMWSWRSCGADDIARRWEAEPVVQPGDRLFVREACIIEAAYATDPEGSRLRYAVPDPRQDAPREVVVPWRPKPDRMSAKLPSMHMPRAASRLTLPVLDVRLQRLSAMTEADAVAEGVASPVLMALLAERGAHPAELQAASPLRLYELLWDAINPDHPWASDPWVIATSFDVQRRNIDAPEPPPAR